MKTRNIIYILGLIVIIIAFIDQCTQDPRVITKTETIEKIVIDTFYKDRTVIKEIEKPVYINRVVTEKGKDSLIYVEKPNDSTITARQFKTTLESNKAKADLNIISIGEVLDVTGTITYPEKETITTITKTKDRSGFYIYGKAPIISQNFSPEIGIQANIRNKMFFSGGVQYNNINNNVNVLVGIGVKLF